MAKTRPLLRAMGNLVRTWFWSTVVLLFAILYVLLATVLGKVTFEVTQVSLELILLIMSLATAPQVALRLATAGSAAVPGCEAWSRAAI